MTCCTQSYCLDAALRPRLALYLTSYQTKFLITSRNVPNLYNWQVALVFVKYWNSVLELGKNCFDFLQK